MNSVLNGVSLDSVQTVLVKFFFSNQRHIPQGIKVGKLTDFHNQDDNHAINASLQGRIDLAEVGRVRPGRVDTGENVVKDLQRVQLGVIRRGLTNAGFQLSQVNSFYHEHKRKFVVVLGFTKGGYYEEAAATEEERRSHAILNSPETVEALRALGRTTWQWCHVWDNSEVSQTATINVGGMLTDTTPLYAIAIRERTIVPVEQFFVLSEDKE